MNKLIKSTILALAVLLGGMAYSQEPGHHTVKPAEFKALVDGGKGIVIDVRTSGEFAKGTIKGAVNYDYFKALKTEMDKLDKSKTYLIFDHTGTRGPKAMAMMKDKGFKTIYLLQGGYSAYKSMK